MNKEQITALAREHGTSYTNRHAPGEPAFAFGNEAWAVFCDALVAVQPVQPAPTADTLLAELRHLAWKEGAINTVRAIDAVIGTPQERRAQPVQPACYVNGDEFDNMLDDRTATIQPAPCRYRKTPLYRAIAQPVEVQPLTDAEITQLWGDLQARKIKEARAAHAGQLDKLCGVCGLGSYRLDNNGYNSFLRCDRDQCRNVPMCVDGIDLSAGNNLAEFVRANNGIKPAGTQPIRTPK